MATNRSDNMLKAQLLSLHRLGYEMYLTGTNDEIISSRVYSFSSQMQESLKRYNFATNGVQFTVTNGVYVKNLVIRSLIKQEVIRTVYVNTTPASNGILSLSNIWIELPTLSPIV